MTEGVSAMHQTSMAWRHLHRKDDISPIVKTQGKKQLGKESNSNSQNWKRKCENKDWNHGIDTAYSGYRDSTIPWFHVEKKKPTQRYKREMRQNRNWLKASLFSSTPSFILNLAHFSYPCIIPCSWSSVLLNGMAATRILTWWSVPVSWMPFL